MLGCQPVGQLPLNADEVSKTLIPLVEILKETLRGDLVLVLETGSSLIGMPKADITQELVAKTCDSAHPTKVAGGEKRMELAKSEVVVGARHDQKRKIFFRQELLSDIGNKVPVLLRQTAIDALQPSHTIGEFLVPLLWLVKESVLVECVGLAFAERHSFRGGLIHGILIFLVVLYMKCSLEIIVANEILDGSDMIGSSFLENEGNFLAKRDIRMVGYVNRIAMIRLFVNYIL